MKYGMFSPDGRIDTAHNDETLEILPQNALELTDEQWDNRFDIKLENGEIVSAPFVLPLDGRKIKRKDEIKREANALVDVQIGRDPRAQLKMVASGLNMLDAQVGRGGAPARDVRMDELTAIFAYVEAVDVEEKAAFDAVNLSDDPSTVILTQPPLPNV